MTLDPLARTPHGPSSRLQAGLPLLVFLAVLALSWLVVLRVESYYGHLLRGWDAQFYYATARSLVHDRDFDVTNDMPLAPVLAPFDLNGDGTLEQLPRYGDRVQNKYPVGLGIAEAPWLALGGVLRGAMQEASDRAPGYSPLEIRTVAFGLIVYFALGMALLARLLTRVVRPFLAAVAVGAAWLGTSLFFYSAVFPFMAHAVACTLIVLLIAIALRGFDRPERVASSLTLLGLVAGCLFMVRPQQITIALPLGLALLLTWRSHRAAFAPRSIAIGVALAAVVFGACVVLQITANRLSMGVASVNAYAAGGEGFDVLHPSLHMVLTSGSRGWLIFSPLVLLALVGYVRASISGRMPWWGHVLAFQTLVQAYLVAAWSSPHQGDAFGARMLSEMAPWVAIGVASLLTARSRAIRAAWLVGTGACVAWTMVLLTVFVKAGISTAVTLPELLAKLPGR
jgi:hypothetical protein